MDPTVRPATPDDLGGVVATLTASFQDDPMMAWVFPDAARRARRLDVLWRFLAEGIYLPAGASTVTARAATDHAAVALWQAPDAPSSEAFWAEHGERFAAELEGELDRLGVLSEVFGAHHPTDADHWYLLAIGVSPASQGQGLGGRLLAHTLAAADRRGAGAYLEATTPRSQRLYERFGFETIAEIVLPDGGPPVWGMWREPT